MNRSVSRLYWLQALVAFALLQLPTARTPAQYANRYAHGSASTSTTSSLTSVSPSNRSGYAHSAMSPGMLHAEGYDDLAYFRPETSPEGKYRKPSAIERVDDHIALICTASGGEFYELDLRDGTISRVHADASRRWSRLFALDQQHMLAIDIAKDEAVVVTRQTGRWSVRAVLSTPGHPHSAAWDSQSKTLYISGQWSQRLFRFVASEDLAGWQPLPVIDLPLHGGAIALFPASQSLIVADAFGGDYVVLQEHRRDQPASTHVTQTNQTRLFAQNIPSLHVLEDDNWVIFPFQLLNPETHSVQGDITWGGLLSNNIRWLKADRMLTLQGDEVMKQSKFMPLGEVGNGGGDPNSLSIFSDGKFAVTLGGIDHVAVGRLGEPQLQQYPVGLHPVDSVFSPDGRVLFVLNEFSDSVSRVDLDSAKVDNLPLGPLREPTLVERGERLFFHSKLSHDGWMSCHSCHSQGHTSGQLNDNTSDGSLGSPKRILSLLGQAETGPYSWGGEIDDLEQQVLNSLQSTMATDHQIARGTVDAIAAYVRSLPPPPSIQAARRELASQSRIAAGRELFEQLACNSCHAGPTFTSAGRYDVNLHDERGQREFNPPSLIGLSQRSRSLLHDGRARSIKAMFTDYRHQLPRELDASEITILIDYLNSL